MNATAQSAEPRPRVLVVQHEDDAGLGHLEPPLAGAADLDVRRPDLGDELPEDLTGFDGLIVLGGAMGASYDEVAPWLPQTRRLLAAGVEGGVPTLGVCLGAQLLAVATGGRVEQGAAGLEVGLVGVVLTAAADGDPVAAALAGTARAPSAADEPGAVREPGVAVSVAQWHQDAITELPPGAVLLASGARYPHQAYRLGAAAWGVQYHPEVTIKDFEAWMRDGHGAVRAIELDPDAVLADVRAEQEHLVALGEAHGRAFAAALQVRPAG